MNFQIETKTYMIRKHDQRYIKKQKNEKETEKRLMHHLCSPRKIPSSSSPSLSDKSSPCFFAWAPVVEAGREIERHRDIQNRSLGETQEGQEAVQ